MELGLEVPDPSSGEAAARFLQEGAGPGPDPGRVRRADGLRRRPPRPDRRGRTGRGRSGPISRPAASCSRGWVVRPVTCRSSGRWRGSTATCSCTTWGRNSPTRAAIRGDRAGLGRRGQGQEWRTPPLWGFRDSGPYLHDGRAESLEEAVAMHGGQGGRSARRYFEWSPGSVSGSRPSSTPRRARVEPVP